MIVHPKHGKMASDISWVCPMRMQRNRPQVVLWRCPGVVPQMARVGTPAESRLVSLTGGTCTQAACMMGKGKYFNHVRVRECVCARVRTRIRACVHVSVKAHAQPPPPPQHPQVLCRPGPGKSPAWVRLPFTKRSHRHQECHSGCRLLPDMPQLEPGYVCAHCPSGNATAKFRGS